LHGASPPPLGVLAFPLTAGFAGPSCNPASWRTAGGEGGSEKLTGWSGRSEAEPSEPRPSDCRCWGEGAARPFSRLNDDLAGIAGTISGAWPRPMRGSSRGSAETPARRLGRSRQAEIEPCPKGRTRVYDSCNLAGALLYWCRTVPAWAAAQLGPRGCRPSGLYSVERRTGRKIRTLFTRPRAPGPSAEAASRAASAQRRYLAW
jgi:hypothetical protein